MAKPRPDVSTDMKPIDLGSPTILQLLEARNTASTEVMYYLETACDAVLECRQCRSLFRSLANFVCHKRIYCKKTDSAEITASMRQHYSKETVVVEPTDPDEYRKTKTTTAQRHKKRKPIRQAPTSATSQPPLEPVTSEKRVTLSAIEGVSCAVTQKTDSISDDAGSASLVDSMNASESGNVTVVQPKDGYPNMNLRQRAARAKHIDLDDYEDLMDQDDESEEEGTSERGMGVPFNPASPKTSSSNHESAAKVLAKRRDCDVKSLRCLNCNTRYSTIKTLHYHMTNTHGKQRKFYPCIYCDNVFSQFWGVTRHLKKNHHLTNEGINLIREKIRARIYTRTLNNGQTDEAKEQTDAFNSEKTSPSSNEKAGSTSDKEKSSVSSKVNSNNNNTAAAAANTAKALCCETCGKEFGKRQYLLLHSVACSRKSVRNGKTNTAAETASSKATTTGEQTSTPTSSSSSTPIATKQNTASPGASGKSNKPLIFVCKTCSRAFSMRQNMTQHAAACARRQKHVSGKTDKESKSDIGNTRNNDKTTTKLKPSVSEVKSKESKSKEIRKQTILEPHDDVLLDLSPSDSSKDEEQLMDTDTLLNSRPKRNIRPKQFHDGTIRIPEVVKIKQPDGSLVYKLREDVEALAVAPPSKLVVPQIKGGGSTGSDNSSSKDSSGLDILVEGQSVPLLGPDDEIKIERMVDMRKLICLKCKKEYGSISNLRRHAVRHLGWRRFKCKLCKFTSYNKSECKTHLRKSHAKETSTLLDYGLHPYIIDLGALLDDTCEDNVVELSLLVPSTNNNVSNETTSPAARSPKTRSRSVAKPDDETGTPTDADSNMSTARPKSRGRKSDTSGADGAKPRGRPRKHPAPDSNRGSLSQDENSKRQKLNPRPKSAQTRISSDMVSSQSEGTTSSSPSVVGSQTKHKDQASKLEGLVTVLKSKTPLADSASGQTVPSETVKSEVAATLSAVSDSTDQAESGKDDSKLVTSN